MRTETPYRASNAAEQITAQEKALGDLLARLMKDPLDPVRESVSALAQRLQAVEDLSLQTREESLPALQAEFNQVGQDLTRQVRRLKDSLDESIEQRLTSALAPFRSDIKLVDDRLVAAAMALDSTRERQEALQVEVRQVGSRLAVLEAGLDAGMARQVSLQADVRQVHGRLEAVSTTLDEDRQRQASLHADVRQVDSRLIAVGVVLDEAQAQQVTQGQALSEAINQSAQTLLAMSQTLNTTNQAAAETASGVQRLHDDVGAAFNTAHAASEQLDQHVQGLGLRLDGHQAATTKQLAALQPELAQQLESLALMVKNSASQVIATQEDSLRVRQSELSTLVQEQLALRVQPLQRTIGWLSLLCGTSLLASLGLLALTLLR